MLRSIVIITMSTSTMSTIVNRESFRSFYLSHKPMKRASFLNKESGETFCKLVFPDFKDTKGNYLMLGFSSNLGELSNQQLAEQIDELQVVELSSGSLKLCKAGEGSWETVDLGI